MRARDPWTTGSRASRIYDAAQRQAHGLQSRPERTKYRCAATAWSRALCPWPNSRRSYEPIWKRPRYWPFWALVERRDSHQAMATASWQYDPKTVQIAARGGSDASFFARPCANLRTQRGDRLRQLPNALLRVRERGARLRLLGARDEQRPSVLEEPDRAAVLPQCRDLALETLVERECALLHLRLAGSLCRASLHRCRRGLCHETEREQANE